MKVFYFNDRPNSVLIRYSKAFAGMVDETLEAHTGKEYDIFIPKGHVLFVKEWAYNTVLISSKEKEKEAK